MANYTATTRSNYFAVKDEQAFKDWCAKWSLDHWQQKEDRGSRRFAITADTGDCCGWPSYSHDEDEQEIDIAAELAEHLADGEIAILMEVGNEKLRYLVGTAVAVNHTGETVIISLSEIYQLAEEAFGRAPTEATY